MSALPTSGRYLDERPNRIGDDLRGRIAILVCGYGLGNSPTLINAAQALARNGYGVDIFTSRSFLGDVRFSDERISLRDIPADRRFASRARRYVGVKARALYGVLPRSRRVRNEQRMQELEVLYYVEAATASMERSKYVCFIGVEPLGLMAARLLGERLGRPSVYYNLELHHEPDITTDHELAAKAIEKAHNEGAAFTITLDGERARLISEENGVPIGSILTVPVCAEGNAFLERTDTLRKRLGLAAGVRIVLYAGFLADWAMSEELAASAQTWPSDRVLVLHSHGYSDPAYIAKLKRFEGPQVRFSMDPVPYDDLPAFLASADIGVALYRDLGVNFTMTASASGKIAHYLKSGLPVIVNSYPAISRVLAAYRCGVAIDSIDQLPMAIERILAEETSMRNEAFRCYEENYRFSRHFAKVLDRIAAL